uniref:pyrroline-5-carboxylate reductase n=1 Tax=Polynucleobacter sp. TaxID=2029855 RepID=UPI004048C510
MTSLANLKIGFIGGGNMASALIGGLIKQGAQANNIFVADPFDQTRQRLERDLSIICAASVDKLASHIENCDVLVMAVKPQQFKEAASELALALKSLAIKPLCLSVVAGIKTADVTKWLGYQRIIRAMPNTPALIGEGMTGLFADTHISAADQSLASSICEAVGKIVWVKSEKQMDDITAVSGSGPAYVFAFLESLEKAGIAQGLSQEQARLLAVQTLHGAAKLAAQSSESPATLRERVTSKGGTTHAALTVLEQESWAQIMMKAVAAASQRSEAMGQEFSNQ